jgi:hypothetical protein
VRDGLHASGMRPTGFGGVIGGRRQAGEEKRRKDLPMDVTTAFTDRRIDLCLMLCDNSPSHR